MSLSAVARVYFKVAVNIPMAAAVFQESLLVCLIGMARVMIEKSG